MKKLWPFAFSLLYSASVASVFPYMALYYQGLGFTGAQIGVLSSLGPLITLFGAPLWTGLADVTQRHRLAMSLCLLVGAVTMLLFPLLRSFAPVLLVGILFSAFFAPVSSFADSATMVMLGDETEMYSRVRLGGTIGFGLTGLLAGMLVQSFGLKWAFWGSAILFLLTFFVSQKLVYGQAKENDPARFDLRMLLTNPRWLLFLSLAVGGGLSLAATNTYFFPYLKEMGIRESLMGTTLALGTLSEIPVLFWGNRLVKRLKPYGLLMLTVIVTIVRFLLYAVIRTPNPVLFIQLFNGLTFPAMCVAGVSYAYENAPPGMGATAQGIFSATVFGLGASLGGFIGGLLLESVGGRGLYLVFGLVLLAIAVIVTLIERRLSTKHETLGKGEWSPHRKERKGYKGIGCRRQGD
jgi:PPP family 3-phenylpropionic acid transporter